MDYPKHTDTINMEYGIFCIFRGFISKCVVTAQKTLMNCRLEGHFSWVFTVCQTTCLPIPRMKWLNVHTQLPIVARKASEYKLEIPQSQTRDQPTAPGERDTEHQQSLKVTNSFFFLSEMIAQSRELKIWCSRHKIHTQTINPLAQYWLLPTETF